VQAPVVKHLSEEKRLKALSDYQITDTDPQPEYDAITRLASYICGTPISLITLVGERQTWIKSKQGIEINEVPRDLTICQYTIQCDGLLEIPDTHTDARLANNPIINSDLNIRFYAGAPLITPEGHHLGALCVIDHEPRSLTPQQRDALQTLAGEVISHLEVSKKNRQLRETLARYEEFSMMFNTSSELHCIIGSDGSIDVINNAVKDILGYDVHDVLGQNIGKFAVNGTAPEMPGLPDGHGCSAQDRIEFETLLKTKSGEHRWISWNAAARQNKWFAHGRDVTPDKQLLAELEQLSIVANKVTSGVVISNSENKVVWVNAAFAEITGYTIGDVAGCRLGDIIKGKDTDEEAIRSAREFNKNKKSFYVELLAYRKNDEPVWLSVMNSVILNERGEFDKVVEIITNITQRKRAEEKLETLSIASSRSSSGIFVRQAGGEIVWFNDAFETITGYTLEELKGKKFGDRLLGPDTDLQTSETAKSALKEQKPYEVEILIYRKDGKPVWVFISNNPLYNQEGETERQVGIIVDISERKKVEQELIKTREEALQLSRAKEMFVSVMSHEIRTPLNAVIGMAHILREDNPTPVQLEHLDILKFSAENLMALLNAILDYTKIETGNLVLESTDVNLRELVTRTMDSFLFKANEKGIALHYEIDPRIPDLVLGDQTRLYQVLINLLGNSIKFTHEGSVRLRLALVSDTPETITIGFVIADTGIGIEKDKIDYIFEAYTQAKSDTSRKYGGTGLGLAITKRLIELFGSKIRVVSEEGNGSEFSFSIPFKRADSRNSSEMKESYKQFSKVILVVDDNDINRLLARKMLSKWGIETEIAENGRIAVQKVIENKYDMVLMDIHMPEMNGFEAVKEIRKLKGGYFEKLPIIALTASIMNDELNTIAASGMNDYVQKPFSPDELYKKIERYFG
jgi:PAS domain S-box-containing protein